MSGQQRPGQGREKGGVTDSTGEITGRRDKLIIIPDINDTVKLS